MRAPRFLRLPPLRQKMQLLDVHGSRQRWTRLSAAIVFVEKSLPPRRRRRNRRTVAHQSMHPLQSQPRMQSRRTLLCLFLLRRRSRPMPRQSHTSMKALLLWTLLQRNRLRKGMRRSRNMLVMSSSITC